MAAQHLVWRELALDDPQVLSDAAILSHVTFDSLALIVGQVLPQKPSPSLDAEQVSVRALRHEVGMQDRLRDDLQPRPLAHNLVAPGHLPL